jgi:D-glycero-D-manno-heptose 1,7-bisphosphate phosphatase
MVNMSKNTIFLDRDGTINKLIERSNGELTPPWTLEEFKFKKDVTLAIDVLKKLGYNLVVITNQPDIKAGLMKMKELTKINEVLYDLGIKCVLSALERNSIYYKPKTGSFELYYNCFDTDIKNSFMIGDSWKDVVAGYNVGLITIYIGYEYSSPVEYQDINPDFICASLYDASLLIKTIGVKRNEIIQ